MGVILTFIPAALLVWAVQRWVHSKPMFELPLWRSYTAFTAFSLSCISVLLWVFLLTWSLIGVGFPFYDPVLLSAYRWGLQVSLVGFVCSFPGKGKLRWPACGLSFLMFFLWFTAAEGE